MKNQQIIKKQKKNKKIKKIKKKKKKIYYLIVTKIKMKINQYLITANTPQTNILTIIIENSLK